MHTWATWLNLLSCALWCIFACRWIATCGFGLPCPCCTCLWTCIYAWATWPDVLSHTFWCMLAILANCIHILWLMPAPQSCTCCLSLSITFHFLREVEWLYCLSICQLQHPRESSAGRKWSKTAFEFFVYWEMKDAYLATFDNSAVLESYRAEL